MGFPFAKNPNASASSGASSTKAPSSLATRKGFLPFGRLGKLHGNDGEIEGSNGFVGYLLIYLHGWLKLYGQLVGKYTINVGRGRIFTYMTG